MLRSVATAILLAFGTAQDNVVDEVRAAKSNCLITRHLGTALISFVCLAQRADDAPLSPPPPLCRCD